MRPIPLGAAAVASRQSQRLSLLRLNIESNDSTVSGAQLSEVPEVFPELGPALAQVPADKNVGMTARFLVLYAISIPGMPSHFTGGEFSLQVATRQANDDQRFRRRVATAALP